MSVNYTLTRAVENFGQSCEKIQTVFIFVRYGETPHMSKKKSVRLKAHTSFLGRVLYFPIPHSNEHRLHIGLSNYLLLVTHLSGTTPGAHAVTEEGRGSRSPVASGYSDTQQTLTQCCCSISDHEALTQCCSHVGPPFLTSANH